MKKVVIFSGIEPGKKGAGKFIKFFIDQCEKNQLHTEINYIHTPQNLLVKILKKTPIFKVIKNFYYSIYRFFTPFKANIRDKTVIFHPQSLGLNYVSNLISNGSDIYFYVLDNFFFCIKSYNHLLNENVECLKCLTNSVESKNNECKSFPNHTTYNEHLKFIELLAKSVNKITFLTQNDGQKKLIQEKFGENSKIIKVGMFTGEFSTHDKNEYSNFTNKYDFIYHNTLVEAKGIKYFVSLSEVMTSRVFVIPYEKSETEKVLGRKINNTNLFFKPCNWDNGLKEMIKEAKVTIVPSLWSSPIEGALLKSLYYSKNVAVVDIKTSFVSEIPNNICIKLTHSIIKSSEMLENYLLSGVNYNYVSRDWVTKFSSKNIDMITDFINDRLK